MHLFYQIRYGGKMNFLDKLNNLMMEQGLNKNSLSKASDIPYTTIDGWYKKGYDNLRISTLKKLAAFFNTSLDYWVYDSEDQATKLSIERQKLISGISQLDDAQFHLVNRIVNSILNKTD